MGKALNLAGCMFGYLLAKTENGQDEKGNNLWLCECRCGKLIVTRGYKLKSGHTKSCGCLQREKMKKRKTHGNSIRGKTTSEYYTWQAMKDRCCNPKNRFYVNYGGRGIKVCDRWQAFGSFISDMGNKSAPELTLDRINNNGNYEPSNCRWATREVQSTNQRLRAGKTSKYKGVSYESKSRKWKAQIYINKKQFNIGRYETEDEAYKAIIKRNNKAWFTPEVEGD